MIGVNGRKVNRRYAGIGLGQCSGNEACDTAGIGLIFVRKRFGSSAGGIVMSWLKKLQSENKYVVFFFLYIGFCISYIDRSAIGLSLPSISKEFNLAPTEMGVVISAFFIGYSIMQIPGGWLADHLGSKTVILVAMTLWSIFTLSLIHI